MQSENP